MEVFQFLLPAIVLSTLLVGIHSYLGMHVIRREILFVDISLSQVSVLGSVISLFWFSEEAKGIQAVFALGSCTLVALILSWLKQKESKIPQEVIIGVTYAMASGLMILLLDRSPHGAEHIKEALVGNILFVTWEQVVVTLMVYAGVALVHWIFRRQFWESTTNKKRSFFWDFLFYFLFGVVITLSTQHAGVLVVFSMLVIPAALAMRWTHSLNSQLITSWGIGFFGILFSFILSYKYDFPAGPMIVSVLSVFFFICLIVSLVSKQQINQR